MHKDVGRWYLVHPKGTAHKTVYVEAGGFLYLLCGGCDLLQTVDEVDAGLPVASKEVAS